MTKSKQTEIGENNAVHKNPVGRIDTLNTRSFWYSLLCLIIGPLHDPVTWYGINYTGTQITQWDFQNKGTRTGPARLSFVLKVPLRNLRPSVIYSVPCDRIVQRAYSVFSHKVSTSGKTVPGIQLVWGSTKTVRDKVAKGERRKERETM